MLPEWLREMAGSIRGDYKGELKFTEIVAMGIALTSSMEHGVTKQSWLDSVMSAKEVGADFATSVEERVNDLCPEHAGKTNDWRNMPLYTERISLKFYRILEAFMMEHKLVVPPFGQTWLREPSLLLRARQRSSGAEFATEEEQVYVLKRWLGQLTNVVKTSGDGICAESIKAAARHQSLSNAKRKEMITITKKYFLIFIVDAIMSLPLTMAMTWIT